MPAKIAVSLYFPTSSQNKGPLQNSAGPQSVDKRKSQRLRREEGCGREPSGFLSRVDSETSLHRERLSEKTLSSLQTCSAWRNALFRQAEGPLQNAAAPNDSFYLHCPASQGFKTSSNAESLTNSGIWSMGASTVIVWPPSYPLPVQTSVQFTPSGRYTLRSRCSA